MDKRDLKTEALILRRTNYGETDRILNVLTPLGKKSVLAKGVRRERSKLAGGVELFSLTEIGLHEGKGELAILTSAKPKKFYRHLLGNVEKLEAAGEVLKLVSKRAEQVEDAGFFNIAKQAIEALDEESNIEIIMAWFYLNLAKTSGEQINLLFDDNGNRLIEGAQYSWDSTERTLKVNTNGRIGTNEIKMMRLMLLGDLGLVKRVKNDNVDISEIVYIAKALNQM